MNWYKISQSRSEIKPVDFNLKEKNLPASIRRKINNALHDLGNYHQDIPLTEIFDICDNNGVIAIQEDGTRWSGLLLGNAVCGSEKARSQNALIHLALKEGDAYIPTSNALNISWCTMEPSGRYEVVCYVG